LTDLNFPNIDDGDDLTKYLVSVFSNYLETASQSLVDAIAHGSSHFILSDRVWSVFYLIDWKTVNRDRERVNRLRSAKSKDKLPTTRKGKLPVELYGEMAKKAVQQIPPFDSKRKKKFQDSFRNENIHFFQIPCQHFVIRNDDPDFLKCLLGHAYDGYCMSKNKDLKKLQKLFMAYIRLDEEMKEVPDNQKESVKNNIAKVRKLDAKFGPTVITEGAAKADQRAWQLWRRMPFQDNLREVLKADLAYEA
jgi:hypothetical protein